MLKKRLCLFLLFLFALSFFPETRFYFGSRAFALEPKMVLLEEFTATWCPPCALANPELEDLYEENEIQFVLVKYHVSDPYECKFSRDRSTKYEAKYIPDFLVDGKPAVVGYIENFKKVLSEKIKTASEISTTIAIESSAKWLKEDEVEYTIQWKGDYKGKKACAVIMQDFLYSAGPNGEKIHRFVVREGQSIGSLENDIDTFTFSIDPEWSNEVLVGAVWVEDEDCILQSQRVPISVYQKDSKQPIFSSWPNRIDFNEIANDSVEKKNLVFVNAGEEAGTIKVKAKDDFIKLAIPKEELEIKAISQKKIIVEIDGSKLIPGKYSSEITLEGLNYKKIIPVLFEIIPAPEAIIDPLSIDYGRCTKDTVPVLKIKISNKNQGSIKAKLKPSAKWIQLSSTYFYEHEQQIEIKIDASQLTPYLYTERIEVVTTGGNFIIPIRLDLVTKKVKILLTIDNPVATIDGVPQEPLERPPFIMGGRTYVPIRFISEAMGAKVEYDAKDKKIVITYQDISLLLQINNPIMHINEKEEKLDASPLIRMGRTFVPLRAIAQAFGATVNYISETRTIEIIF